MIRLAIVAIAISIAAPAISQEIRPITKQQVCTAQWSKNERHVSAAMKRRVFERDGYPLGQNDSRCPCVIDHKIPLEVGGSNTEENLQVQQETGQCNSHEKDQLEDQIHRDLCTSPMSLQSAQSWFNDWRAAYLKRFGKSC